jgi:CHAD domain-containing protein
MRALKPRDKVGSAVQSAFLNDAERCVELLTGKISEPITDGAVHEIRTRIKQMRALLYFVRAKMSKERYARVKRKLRQTSRSLGSLRDAKVMLTTSEKLLQHRRAAECAVLSDTLGRRLEAARRKLAPPRRRSMADDLVSAQDAVSGSSASEAGWKALAAGLRHEYRGARTAFEANRLAPSEPHLHELRKRAKGVLYMCQFLGEMSPYAGSQARRLKRLTDYLGRDHDLSVLRRATFSEHLERMAGTRQQGLQRKAARLGASLFVDSAATFTKRVHQEWKSQR